MSNLDLIIINVIPSKWVHEAPEDLWKLVEGTGLPQISNFSKIQIVSALFPRIFIMHKSIIILCAQVICEISHSAVRVWFQSTYRATILTTLTVFVHYLHKGRKEFQFGYLDGTELLDVLLACQMYSIWINTKMEKISQARNTVIV